MSKEQKITFTIRKNSEGKMSISVKTNPKLAKTKEAFESLPMENREMQNTAADIVQYVMNALAERERTLQS